MISTSLTHSKLIGAASTPNPGLPTLRPSTLNLFSGDVAPPIATPVASVLAPGAIVATAWNDWTPATPIGVTGTRDTISWSMWRPVLVDPTSTVGGSATTTISSL